jgi:AcrR family transcriptional regulator
VTPALNNVDGERRMIEMGLGQPPGERDTRSRIVAVAAAQFGERGYPSTTLRQIADAVGMTPPALYWHFPSKRAILRALLQATLFDFLDAVEADVTGPTPEDKLRQFVRGHVLRTLSQPRIGPYEAFFGVRQLAQFLSLEEKADLIAAQRRHLDLLRETLREGIECGSFGLLDVTTTAFAVLSMCNSVNGWWKPGGRIGAEELACRYEEMVIRLVRPA